MWQKGGVPPVVGRDKRMTNRSFFFLVLPKGRIGKVFTDVLSASGLVFSGRFEWVVLEYMVAKPFVTMYIHGGNTVLNMQQQQCLN